MMQFIAVGNWKGVSAALQGLPLSVMASARWGMEKAASQLENIVKGHINAQDLGWPQRAWNTVSGDPRILVDTEAYYNAIEHWRKNNVWYVGVKANKYNHRGIRIADYAINHEEGITVPRRPLWGPSIREFQNNGGPTAIVERAILSKIVKLRTLGMSITYRPGLR
jgi:hypothetical protein